ncbi:trmJ [Symbiodinium sp. CCMP2456]|nr:trmJ [Symbiodinium sp. CCMP2456]
MSGRVWTSEVNYTYSPEQLLVLVGKLHKQLLGSLAAVRLAALPAPFSVLPFHKMLPFSTLSAYCLLRARMVGLGKAAPTNTRTLAQHIYSIMIAGPSYEGSIDRANQHIIELGGLPQELKGLPEQMRVNPRCSVRAKLWEKPTHATCDFEVSPAQCATLAATSSTRSLRCKDVRHINYCLFRPVSIELSEPDLTQAVPGVQKEDDEEEDVEAMSWHLYDEVFKPFALSAQKAIGAMEARLSFDVSILLMPLLVRLRHAQREDAGHNRPTPSYSSSHPGPGLEEESREANLLSERFRSETRGGVAQPPMEAREPSVKKVVGCDAKGNRAADARQIPEGPLQAVLDGIWSYYDLRSTSYFVEAVGVSSVFVRNFVTLQKPVVHAAKLEAAVSRASRSAEKARQLGIDADQITEAPSSSSVHCALDLSAWKGCERLATTEGEEVLQSAKLYGNLKAALSGAGLSIAFSGRQGRNFREPTLTLKKLAQKLASTSTAEVGQVAASDNSGEGLSRQVALVFGSEDVGLSTESVLLCTDVCRLQTGSCPSLNLSHAVAVVLARIFEEVQEEPPSCSSAQATKAAADGAVPKDEIPAPVWTSDWSELCRARLEAQGYPAKAELWHGRGRRKCLYTYRLFRVVAECARSLQRTNATDSEVKAWTNLVQSLSQASGKNPSILKFTIHFLESCWFAPEQQLTKVNVSLMEKIWIQRAFQKSSEMSWSKALQRRMAFYFDLSVARSKTMSLDVPKEANTDTFCEGGGTGDTGGEASGSSTLESEHECRCQGARGKASMDMDARASMQGEALVCGSVDLAVQTDLKQQALLERRSSKLRDLMGECGLQSKDLQISALRHQASVPDEDSRKAHRNSGYRAAAKERFRFETLDSELEALLEKAAGPELVVFLFSPPPSPPFAEALSPLTAILTREQTARTVATSGPWRICADVAPLHQWSASKTSASGWTFCWGFIGGGLQYQLQLLMGWEQPVQNWSCIEQTGVGMYPLRIFVAKRRFCHKYFLILVVSIKQVLRTNRCLKQALATGRVARRHGRDSFRFQSKGEHAAVIFKIVKCTVKRRLVKMLLPELRRSLETKHFKQRHLTTPCDKLAYRILRPEPAQVASLQATAVNAELRDRLEALSELQQRLKTVKSQWQDVAASSLSPVKEDDVAMSIAEPCLITEDHTSFMSLGAGVGAAAGGMGAFMLCASKCPGGIGGSLGGMLGAMNPMNLMPFGSEKEEKEADEVKEPESKMQKQLNYIEKELCNMNCKMAGLMGAAAGGAAGHVVEKKLKEKSEAEAAADQEAEAEEAPAPAAPAPAPYKGGGKGGYGYPPPPPPGYYRHPPPPYRRPPPYYHGGGGGPPPRQSFM